MNQLLRWLLPPRVRQWVFYRFEKGTPPSAPYPLHFAPGVFLRDIVSTDMVGRSIAFTGFYELDLSKRLCKRARTTGGVFVDVGANIGYFTHLWLAGNPENRVIAFEASPRVVPILHRNLEAHPDWTGKVEIYEFAAGDRDGMIRFDVGPPDQTGWGGMASCEASGSVVEVRSVRLDTVIPPDVIVDFLKIDVEGADPLVILGSEGLFRRRAVRAGVFEVNQDRMRKLGLTVGPAVDLLQDCGYSIIAGEGECAFFLDI